MSENHGSSPPTPQPFCSVYVRLLPLLHTDLLSVEERSDVEAHLAECAWCQNQLATYDVLDAALRRQFAGDAAASPVAAPRTRRPLSLEKVMQVSNQPPVSTTPPAPRGTQPRNSRLSMLGAAAAVLVLTILAASLFAYFGSRGAAPAAPPTPTPTPTPEPAVPPPFDLGAHLLATAVLDAAALLIAALICGALGVFMRVRPRAATALIATVRPLLLAVPVFVLGPLLVFVFVLQSHLFLAGATNEQLFDVRRLFLPALTLAIGALALTLAQVRSDLFAFARADGSRAASWVHSWAVIGLHLLGATLSWTFVVEINFAWPGIGSSAYGYGVFLYGSNLQDLGPLWSIVLVTSAFYLVVALAVNAAARLLARRGALTDAGTDGGTDGGTDAETDSAPVASEPPGAGRGDGRILPRWVVLTLLGIGTALVVAVVLATSFAPLLTRYNPGFINISLINNPPSAAHPLGTDDLGRDILSQLLYMGRVSLGIGALAVILAAASGMALGVLLGFIPTERRRLGAVVDKALPALMAFPALFVALGLVDLLHPGYTSLVIAFAILQVPTFARLGLRLLQPHIRDSDDRSPVVQRQSTPNVVGQLLAQASISMAIVLVEVSALTFFAGSFFTDLQPPPFSGVTAYVPGLFDWGSLIGSVALQGPQTLPLWRLLVPALALGISVLGFTVVGQALRSLLDSRTAPSQQQEAPSER